MVFIHATGVRFSYGLQILKTTVKTVVFYNNMISHYLKSIKYIKGLVQFNEDKIDQIIFKDEFYNGLDNKKTELRVFYAKNKLAQSIIIFPGASPYAEKHPGMIMLANALRNAGYHVFLPRVPNLKKLKLVKENVEWFVHCYLELLQHSHINSKNIMVVGLSYGGANLLKSCLDERIKANPPKSILSYGTYFSIDTALNFFLTGKIKYQNKTYNIKPHEWGMIVIFYNFLLSIDTKHDKKTITKILKYRIEDKFEEVEKIKSTLNKEDSKFVDAILSGTITPELKKLIDQMLKKNKDLLEYLSPNFWAKNIDYKTFVIHGANDSMVPFTESTLLAKSIPNSKLLISFLYEHREISTDRGMLFKIKELIKMINFFADYFKFNK